jgi:multicomponent Na+:H+ antiporter subunit F
MTTIYLALVVFLLLTLMAGLWRILQGPEEIDRMLAGQLIGTTTVACLLLLAKIFAHSALYDVALVLALLSAFSVVAFVRLRGDL